MELSKIISAAKKQDRKAQTALFNEFKVVWYQICLRYNGNKADASDVLQNSMIKIFKKIDQFDETKGSFKSWSGKVVVNESLMYLRKKVNAFKNDEIVDDLNVVDENETPLDIISAQELTKLIQRLPNGYRTVFNLYVIEGYNHKEIGELLGINTGTSKSQLSKARKILQQQLEVLI